MSSQLNEPTVLALPSTSYSNKFALPSTSNLNDYTLPIFISSLYANRLIPKNAVQDVVEGIQLSLHTLVVYTKISIKSYCTVSKNLTHSPAAIWAHLRPIFKTLPPNIKSIHFVSDGPVTQEQNRTEAK